MEALLIAAAGYSRAGIEVSSRIPVVVPKEEMVGPLASYLRTKANRMRHQFESDEFP